MRLDVLAPHQLQGQVPVPAQIPVHLRPVQQRSRLQPMPRAVQFSLCDTVCQCVIDVERVYVEFAGYVFDAVGA
jgi:hypothetical protein